jgi:ElaA protein
VIFRAAGFHELDAATLYALLKLRIDVFVVEQHCAYADLDGRDTQPGTRHLWFEKDRTPVAYLRILDHDGPVARIGRVVTARQARGLGLANQLMAAALAVIGDRAITLDAQSHVVKLYERYGFSPCGPEYLDDGIPHVPMRREAVAGG